MTDAPYTSPKDAGEGPDAPVKYWRTELEFASRAERKWRKRGRKVVERYRDEKDRSGKRFNILWSNVETLKPAIYSATPEPDIRRRFLDDDPAGKEAAEILERAVSFLIDGGDFDEDMEAARDDMLLPGRGVLRVVYDAEIDRKSPLAVMPEGATEPEFFLDDEPVVPDGFDDNDDPFIEEIQGQSVRTEYVFWEDFRIFPAGVRRWRDVYGIGFRHKLTREQLKKQFAEKAASVPLNYTVDEADKKDTDASEPLQRAVVWEIWDKRKRERLWIAEGFDTVLDRDENPLGLNEFFPIPAPLYAVKTTDTMVPIPEFTLYQDQAIELDNITDRIEKLVSALKVRGVYAATIKEFSDLLKGDDNELFPVEDWETIRNKGGLENAIAWMPIEQIAKVMVSLYQQREVIKQEIFEITGLSDIIRGSTDSRETATAQRIKGNFGQFRMTPRQKPVQRFARDIFRIMSEIVAEHFTKENLQEITGRPVSDEVMELLRSDKMRGFRIDIETDSTVQPDADQEREAAVQFTASVTQFLTTAVEVGGQAPELVKVMGEMLKLSVRRFKVGRTIEDSIDEALSALQKRAQQPPPPDPEAEKAKQEMGLKAQESEGNLKIKQQESVANLTLKREEMQGNAALAQMQSQIDMIIKVMEAEHGAGIAAFKAQQGGA